MAEAPYEMVIGPAEVYFAPVGTAFPTVNATPGAPWVRIGTSGADNYSEDGVVVRRSLASSDIRALGSTAIRKAAITETGFEVEFSVMDMSPKEMLLAFGGDETAITVTAQGSGVAGNQAFDVPTAPVPIHRAILVRFGQSPFGNGLNSQFEVFSAYQAGEAEGTFSKSDPFTQGQLWRAIKIAAGFVRVREQQSAPGA